MDTISRMRKLEGEGYSFTITARGFIIKYRKREIHNERDERYGEKVLIPESSLRRLCEANLEKALDFATDHKNSL